MNIVIQCMMHLPTNQCVREGTRGCVECRTYQVCALPSDFQFRAGVVVVIVVVMYQIHKMNEMGIEISLTHGTQRTVRSRLLAGRRGHVGSLELLSLH